MIYREIHLLINLIKQQIVILHLIRAIVKIKWDLTQERDNSTTLRVTNLSKIIQEDDVRSLFSQYGKLNRVYLVKDHVTKESRGFAFVSFNLKEEAQAAMDNLHGYGIYHLILKIDWAK